MDAPLPAPDVEGVFRQAYGAAVATLVRITGDIAAAEDAVQDAFVVAAERWPETGVPANPAGWIVTTARRRGIDAFRRRERGHELARTALDLGANGAEAARDLAVENDEVPTDDQLRLIFTCCHPALRPEHRIALTLRLLGGLTVEEVARSFLVSEPAMARRLSRAKFKIRAAGIPYRVPGASELADRLGSVLSVVYLIYNTGADDLEERASLREEALRLARVLVDLVPGEPEVAGLLALLLLNESRVGARVVDGSVVLLADQDRGRWNRDQIDEGHAIIRRCIEIGRPGPYQIQAAVQAVHADAERYEDTDWPQIVQLYDHLSTFLATPVVAMNRAIALAEVSGPQEGLVELDRLAEQLGNHHLWHASRGAMLRRLGREPEATDAYRTAAGLAPTETARAFLALHTEDAVALRSGDAVALHSEHAVDT